MADKPHSALSKILHWLIALLFFALVGLGAWMVELGYYDRFYHLALDWHRQLGVLVFVLAAGKLLCARAVSADGVSAWERVAGRIAHWALFALLFGLPLSGYIISTSAGDGIALLGGAATLPALFDVSDAARDWAITLHYWAAYLGAGLATLHAAAALKHHFIDKNNVLRRMLKS